MQKSDWTLSPPSQRAEVLALLAAAWILFVSIPLGVGHMGLSWDALNHHVYLGWTAEHPRFDLDFLAASYQSYQYPYLYWPFYKLYQIGMSGQAAGAILVSLNLLAVPPIWLLARNFAGEQSWFGIAMRWCAVALAFLGNVVLSMFGTTANDLLAAIPLVWAVALALEPLDAQRSPWMTTHRLMLLSGFCGGVSVAFKLSNAPLAILLPLLWVMPGNGWLDRTRNVASASAAAVVGYLLAYGYWGWLLWTHYGNPIYPFYGGLFVPLQGLLGWHP